MSRNETLSQLRSQIAALENSRVTSFDMASCESDSPVIFAKTSKRRSCFAEEDLSDSVDAEAEEEAKERPKPEAFDRIVRWTSARFRSEADLRKRLAREHYSQNQIEEAIERASRCLLIDDERFADVLVRSRVRAGKGRLGIESELRKEGIEPSLLPGWPEEYFSEDEDTEFDRALAFLEKHPTRSKNPRQSAYRKLLGKGYSSSVAVAASRTWCERL